MQRRHLTATLVVGCIAVTAPTACGSAGDAGPEAEVDVEVLVLAAASLADAFAQVAEAFEAANPGIDVVTSFGGSNSVAVQVEQGAPADVVAFADQAPMTELLDTGLVDGAEIFATNALALAVPAGNPGGVTSLADLARDDLLIGTCAAEVPCGRYAAAALDAAGVVASLDTAEPDVASLVAKLEAGELDAGLVYVTDVAGSDRLESIELPAGVDVRAAYPIGIPTDAPRPEEARDFVAFVRSDDGARILADAGFALP
ncbi:molybdate ABC transporter substrate-binding protein [Ilumatobacter sp.]|uniref:molybdate ABC transporter substrate-binding protein n=1 Tax=Ilumatobacter sp. TaxID=1967498 RepID=UPI003B528FA9